MGKLEPDQGTASSNERDYLSAHCESGDDKKCVSDEPKDSQKQGCPASSTSLTRTTEHPRGVNEAHLQQLLGTKPRQAEARNLNTTDCSPQQMTNNSSNQGGEVRTIRESSAAAQPEPATAVSTPLSTVFRRDHGGRNGPVACRWSSPSPAPLLGPSPAQEPAANNTSEPPQSTGPPPATEYPLAYQMTMTGACRGDERMRPLLRWNLSCFGPEGHLLADLGQHFRAREIAALVRCLLAPLVSVRVGKVTRRGRMLCPQAIRGRLILVMLAGSDIKVYFLSDSGLAERITTVNGRAEPPITADTEVLSPDRSSRTFSLILPDGRRTYFWNAEKNAQYGAEMVGKVTDLLRNPPTLGDLTGIREQRLDFFGQVVREAIGRATASSQQPGNRSSREGPVSSQLRTSTAAAAATQVVPAPRSTSRASTPGVNAPSSQPSGVAMPHYQRAASLRGELPVMMPRYRTSTSPQTAEAGESTPAPRCQAVPSLSDPLRQQPSRTPGTAGATSRRGLMGWSPRGPRPRALEVAGRPTSAAAPPGTMSTTGPVLITLPAGTLSSSEQQPSRRGQGPPPCEPISSKIDQRLPRSGAQGHPFKSTQPPSRLSTNRSQPCDCRGVWTQARTSFAGHHIGTPPTVAAGNDSMAVCCTAPCLAAGGCGQGAESEGGLGAPETDSCPCPTGNPLTKTEACTVQGSVHLASSACPAAHVSGIPLPVPVRRTAEAVAATCARLGFRARKRTQRAASGLVIPCEMRSLNRDVQSRQGSKDAVEASIDKADIGLERGSRGGAEVERYCGAGDDAATVGSGVSLTSSGMMALLRSAPAPVPKGPVPVTGANMGSFLAATPCPPAYHGAAPPPSVAAALPLGSPRSRRSLPHSTSCMGPYLRTEVPPPSLQLTLDPLTDVPVPGDPMHVDPLQVVTPRWHLNNTPARGTEPGVAPERAKTDALDTRGPTSPACMAGGTTSSPRWQRGQEADCD